MNAKIHWLNPGTKTAACKPKGNSPTLSADPEAVTCGNCRSSKAFAIAYPSFSLEKQGRPAIGQGFTVYVAALSPENKEMFENIPDRAYWLKRVIEHRLARDKKQKS